jgi:hypothetical protein
MKAEPTRDQLEQSLLPFSALIGNGGGLFPVGGVRSFMRKTRNVAR